MEQKYLVNLDAIYQWMECTELDKTGWHLMEDFNECGASYFVDPIDINEDAFDLVAYPADLFDAKLRNDAFDIRSTIEEICLESEMHKKAMRI